MSRLSPTIAKPRIALAIVLFVLALTANGCLAPAQITTAERDTTAPFKPDATQLTKLAPAKVIANDRSESLASPAQKDQSELPSVVLVEAIPLPLEAEKESPQSSPDDKLTAHELPSRLHNHERSELQAAPPTWPLPQLSGTLPSSSPSAHEFSRLPAAEEARPSPSPPMADPTLGPPVVPFTPPVMAPPPHFFSVAQGEPVPLPPAAYFNPPIESLPANPLPLQPAPLPNLVTQQPLRQPAPPPEPIEQPPGQLASVQRIKSIREISLNITAPTVFDDTGAPVAPPADIAAQTLPVLAQQRPFTRGELIDFGYDWQPEPVSLEFCYQPLYFEEVNLERYGRSWGIFQPAISGIQFYSQIPLLPYRIFSQPARRCTYHAHWTLPGYRIPCRERPPLYPSLLGASSETLAIAGLILLIP